MEYFDANNPPENQAKINDLVSKFILENNNSNIVLVTSGGTTVPLEKNTVRFLDNFSAGTRGAASTEYFLKHGYSCIFLHRQFSLGPFTRHYSHSKNCFLDMLQEKGDDLIISAEYKEHMKEIHLQYTRAKQENRLLMIPYTTLSEYMFLLRDLSILLNKTRGSILYLAAAVSDFYIPDSEMIEHKIQSDGNCLDLLLKPVPKVLKLLVSEWANKCFVVTFKLETDANLLQAKASKSLHSYGHEMVIGNMLQTRKHIVWIVTRDETMQLKLSQTDIDNGIEIEQFIIEKLLKKHSDWKSHQIYF